MGENFTCRALSNLWLIFHLTPPFRHCPGIVSLGILNIYMHYHGNTIALSSKNQSNPSPLRIQVIYQSLFCLSSCRRNQIPYLRQCLIEMEIKCKRTGSSGCPTNDSIVSEIEWTYLESIIYDKIIIVRKDRSTYMYTCFPSKRENCFLKICTYCRVTYKTALLRFHIIESIQWKWTGCGY